MTEHLNAFAQNLAGALLSPTSRFFLPYLYVTAGIALVVLYRRTGSVKAALQSLIRRDVFFHRSSLNDCKLVLGNYLLLTMILGFALLNVSALANEIAHVLRSAFGEGPQWRPGLFSALTASFVFLLAYDGGNFAQHWLQHKIPPLWELHKVHHSAEVMTPLTAIRVHPLSQLFTSLFLGVLFGSLSGVFLYLYAGKVALFTVAGANVFLVLHYTVGVYHLQHSHIWLSFPPPFRGVFASPAMHMIHHSKNPKHYGRNFGFALAIWDRLAGTLHIPDEAEQHGLALGLADDEQIEMQTVRQLYLTPLRRIASMLVASKAGIDRPATRPFGDRAGPK